MLPPKARPRYLPTLTHVVTADDLISYKAGNHASVSQSVVLESQTKVQEIVDLLVPTVMARMREELLANLETQLHLSQSKLRIEVESMVRQMLNEAETFSES